jgi:hypothetical protein
MLDVALEFPGHPGVATVEEGDVAATSFADAVIPGGGVVAVLARNNPNPWIGAPSIIFHAETRRLIANEEKFKVVKRLGQNGLHRGLREPLTVMRLEDDGNDGVRH